MNDGHNHCCECITGTAAWMLCMVGQCATARDGGLYQGSSNNCVRRFFLLFYIMELSYSAGALSHLHVSFSQAQAPPVCTCCRGSIPVCRSMKSGPCRPCRHDWALPNYDNDAILFVRKRRGRQQQQKSAEEKRRKQSSRGIGRPST